MAEAVSLADTEEDAGTEGLVDADGMGEGKPLGEKDSATLGEAEAETEPVGLRENDCADDADARRRRTRARAHRRAFGLAERRRMVRACARERLGAAASATPRFGPSLGSGTIGAQPPASADVALCAISSGAAPL